MSDYKKMTNRSLESLSATGQPVRVAGWVATKRGSKQVCFIALQDGTTLHPLQVVLTPSAFAPELIKQLTTGASITVCGHFKPSHGAQQGEVHAVKITLHGQSPGNYPLQPKAHSMDFLRQIPHLRFRTRTFGAIFRIRHHISRAIHDFFHEKGFYWVHTPLITTADAEGGGEVFELHSSNTSRAHFFQEPVFLTVSGQLAGEAAAMGLSKIYTFGPTFRAENTHTSRHLSEFWMVEPEIAFFNLSDTIDLATNLLKRIGHHLLAHASQEIDFLDKRHTRQNAHKSTVNKNTSLNLHNRLNYLLRPQYIQLEYSAAIELLQKAVEEKKVVFEHPVSWGIDLQTEHERYLTQIHPAPVVVKNYPQAIKAFYMRQNADKKTVAAMDILLPQIGEVVGGSQREERLDYLEKAMKQKKISSEKLNWYLDSRRFGSCPHSGFGLGLERLVLYITGMENIRDVIPFPRTPGKIRG